MLPFSRTGGVGSDGDGVAISDVNLHHGKSTYTGTGSAHVATTESNAYPRSMRQKLALLIRASTRARSAILIAYWTGGTIFLEWGTRNPKGRRLERH